MGIFHRETILESPEESWNMYRDNSGYFRFPERVTIELTNRCNLSCSMCPRNNVTMKLGDMQVPLFRKIIDEMAQFLPICAVPFFRGESLVHPQILPLLAYAKEKKIQPIQLATNGYFLDARMTDSILDLAIDFVSFSVDANNPDVYQKIRKNSDFEKVFYNIVYFLEQKKKRKLLVPQIQVSAVKTNQNSLFIEDFLEFWKDKVNRVRIYLAHSLDGRLGHLEGDAQSRDRKPCLKLLSDMVICWNGDVAICNHDWQRNVFVGNVATDSIEKIFNNRIYNALREKHLSNDFIDFSLCNHCSHWESYYRKDHVIGQIHIAGA